MDKNKHFNSILNKLQDANYLVVELQQLSAAPQLDIDLLKEKIRGLYDDVIKLDTMNKEQAVTPAFIHKKEIKQPEPVIEKVEKQEQVDSLANYSLKTTKAEVVKEEVKIKQETAEAIKKQEVVEEQILEPTFTKTEPVVEIEPAVETVPEPIEDETPAVVETPDIVDENSFSADDETEEIDVKEAVSEIEDYFKDVDEELDLSNSNLKLSTSAIDSFKAITNEKETVEQDKKDDDVEEKVTEVSQKDSALHAFIASQKNNFSLAENLNRKPLANIKSGVGINDVFMYTKELFNAVRQDYIDAVADLDQMETIEEALEYIHTNYKWDYEKPAAQKFMNLLARRFMNQ